MQLKPHSEFDTCHRTERKLVRKLRVVIMNDPLGGTKSVDDMFDEVNNIGGFNFSERYSFSPL